MYWKSLLYCVTFWFLYLKYPYPWGFPGNFWIFQGLSFFWVNFLPVFVAFAFVVVAKVFFWPLGLDLKVCLTYRPKYIYHNFVCFSVWLFACLSVFCVCLPKSKHMFLPYFFFTYLCWWLFFTSCSKIEWTSNVFKKILEFFWGIYFWY